MTFGQIAQFSSQTIKCHLVVLASDPVDGCARWWKEPLEINPFSAQTNAKIASKCFFNRFFCAAKFLPQSILLGAPLNMILIGKSVWIFLSFRISADSHHHLLIMKFFLGLIIISATWILWAWVSPHQESTSCRPAQAQRGPSHLPPVQDFFLSSIFYRDNQKHYKGSPSPSVLIIILPAPDHWSVS